MDVGALFVIDSTGSMRWVHRHLCESLSSIVEQFDEEGAAVEFGFTAFRDHKIAPSTWLEHLGFPGSEDVEVATSWLDELKAFGGGGNGGESSIAGLLYAMRNAEWPDTDRRVAVIFTDDNPLIPDLGVHGWDEVHTALKEHNIDQVHLFVDEAHIAGYDDLDDIGYVVVRHTLTKGDTSALEEAIREFVRISSEGGGDFTPIDRDISINPFDSETSNPYEDDSGEDEDIDPAANPWDVD